MLGKTVPMSLIKGKLFYGEYMREVGANDEDAYHKAEVLLCRQRTGPSNT